MKLNEIKCYSNYNSINNNFSSLHSLCHNDLVEFPCFHSFLLHSLCCIQLVAFHWMHSLGCIHKVTSICVCIPTLFIYLQQHRKSMCLAGVNGGHCSWVCAIWMLDHLLSPPSTPVDIFPHVFDFWKICWTIVLPFQAILSTFSLKIPNFLYGHRKGPHPSTHCTLHKEKEALEELVDLQKFGELVIQLTDKGSGICILYRKDYIIEA